MVTYESDRSRFNFMLYLGVIKRTKVYFKNVNLIADHLHLNWEKDVTASLALIFHFVASFL